MSRKPVDNPRSDSGPAADVSHLPLPTPAAVRDIIESIALAVVLALLFRTFEAEAFVIPTGSMAPTLMGRHKDVTCPKCGCPYQLSASDEVNTEGEESGRQFQTVDGTCPMCRYTADVEKEPSYNGDRLLVGKFLYDLADPQRWDVIVFKFPGDATTDSRINFIKRLVGLPGETIRIQHGQIWTRRGQEPFRIARKPPLTLLAMLQPVFDNDYMPRIAKSGWPARWQPEATADGGKAGAWSTDDDAAFSIDGTASGQRWLRYHHLIPSYSQWRLVERDGETPPPTPQLIKDFTAYDTARERGNNNSAPPPDSLGLHWVGDLAASCTADVQNSQGQLVLELRKGGRRFQCRIDVATGQATLSVSGRDMERFRPTAATALRGPGRHKIRFSNCDNELRLWIDDVVVPFDQTTYEELGNATPDESDLTPVGVASVGAKVRISHLRIQRDIYYGALNSAAPREMDYVDFPLAADQFFVLGDNSARSKDGRLWGQDNYWVPRELLIGKAFFLYWPHSWNRIPYVNIPFPYFPNFGKMGLVR